MSDQYIEVEGIGRIRYKRSSKSKHIRLRIDQEGRPVVSSSTYTPKYVVKKFIETKKDWILEHQKDTVIIRNNDIIGRSHKVLFTEGETIKTRVSRNRITVNIPAGINPVDIKVQEAIKKAAVKALRKEAEMFLPSFIEKWRQFGLGEYKELSYKKTTSRWGSYSSNGTLTLSIFCMQLPNELIDYIAVHELAHSKHMNHSKQFWNLVEQYIPNYKKHRKELHNYSMRVVPNSNIDMQ